MRCPSGLSSLPSLLSLGASLESLFPFSQAVPQTKCQSCCFQLQVEPATPGMASAGSRKSYPLSVCHLPTVFCHLLPYPIFPLRYVQPVALRGDPCIPEVL